MDQSQQYIEDLAQRARRAARQLAAISGQKKMQALLAAAASMRRQAGALLEANAADVAAAAQSGLAPNLVERLRLNEKRVSSMAAAVEQIAGQTDPVGQIIEGWVRPNGLRIQKVRVPIGVVLFIYESRPNVTSDAAALCLKSGNAVILRGGKEAMNSNRAIAGIFSAALSEAGMDSAAVQLIESSDRALLPPLLKMDRLIDLVIPRGGENLIRTVVKESTIPVLKHFTGNCHVYVDSATEDMEKQVRDICINAKTGYPGGAVCNAAEKILFHKDAAPRLLPKVCEDLSARGVEIRGCGRTRALWPQARPATEEDWHTEYLALVIAIRVVDSLQEAIDHINTYGSHHTDAIVTQSLRAAEVFVRDVDSGSVMVNASTRFSDGGEYGLGAEVGISTDKLHARGPMGATDLTTYKWVVMGDGHIRP